MKNEKSCGAIVYRKKDSDVEYLIIQNNPDRGGRWSFAKGQVKNGESEYETAQREVQEEVGLKIKTIEGFREQMQYSPAPGVWKTVIFFVAELDTKQTPRKSDEAYAFEWLPFDKAFERITFKETKDILRRANDFLKKHGDDGDDIEDM